MTKTKFSCRMAAILKRGAFLDFQKVTKPCELIQVAFKTYNRAPSSFKSAELIYLLGPTTT